MKDGFAIVAAVGFLALCLSAPVGSANENCYPGLGGCGDESSVPMNGINIGTPSNPVSSSEPDNSQDVPTTFRPSGVSPNGDWFVIAGSYSTVSPDRAMERLRFLRDRGVDAELIDTSRYSQLTNGLIAVVVASRSRNAAFQKLEGVKPHVHDAYVKKGN